MKLNPKKCSFGVEEGPFLGHLVTKQGIKSNPLKVKAVIDLDQPRTLKDIQSLNGKLAALRRFLSKAVERSLAFFKVLKGCKDKKSIQVLQGAELNYPALEKLVLALVHASRRLQRYFQAHTITVLTNTPIKHMLTEPEKTGRVAKWAIKLGENDIVFLRRNEKETPADFLVKITFEYNEKKEKPKEVPDSNSKWRLYTDEASKLDGSGAGLMLIDPECKEYTYALRFEFETTNNEAEYEALLVGLWIAQEMEIAKVVIFLDSQLLERKSWMDPIHEYLLSRLLPEDTQEARKIRIHAPQYKLIRGNMYKRSFFAPWLRCVAGNGYILKDKNYAKKDKTEHEMERA
ncbi:reverse transcriptase domain-containing protein [Tanacetum coccineum]